MKKQNYIYACVGGQYASDKFRLTRYEVVSMGTKRIRVKESWGDKDFEAAKLDRDINMYQTYNANAPVGVGALGRTPLAAMEKLQRLLKQRAEVTRQELRLREEKLDTLSKIIEHGEIPPTSTGTGENIVISALELLAEAAE